MNFEFSSTRPGTVCPPWCLWAWSPRRAAAAATSAAAWGPRGPGGSARIYIGGGNNTIMWGIVLRLRSYPGKMHSFHSLSLSQPLATQWVVAITRQNQPSRDCIVLNRSVQCQILTITCSVFTWTPAKTERPPRRGGRWCPGWPQWSTLWPRHRGRYLSSSLSAAGLHLIKEGLIK